MYLWPRLVGQYNQCQLDLFSIWALAYRNRTSTDPNQLGDQIFSSPVSVADHTRTNVHILATARHWHDAPPSLQPILEPQSSSPSWQEGKSLGQRPRVWYRQPNLWTLSRRGCNSTKTALSSKCREPRPRTTLNSRPHPRLNLGLGLARWQSSLARLTCRRCESNVCHKPTPTSFRPELEAKWRGHGWSVQSGYRHRLVAYDVPLRAA